MGEWVAVVHYDRDGMERAEIRGHRLSTTMWDSGRCLIKAFNAAGELVETFQAARSYSIRRVRAPESGRERSPSSVDDLTDDEVEAWADQPAECCCAGCIGMGPCDDDLGNTDDEYLDDHPIGCNCSSCRRDRDELET